jgi:post-segregation antitoxin (ccd killing protein)
MDINHRPMEVAMTPDNKTVSVYISAELRRRADEAGINLSTTLRDALEAELDRRDALEAARDGMTTQLIDLGGVNDCIRLRFTGEHILGPDPDVYRTEEGKVVLVFEEDYNTFDDVEEFADWVADQRRDNLGQRSEGIIWHAVRGLGGRQVVDL